MNTRNTNTNEWSSCLPHIVSGETVQEALEFGNYGDADTDISQQDSTGGFDLRGIKCVKCGELVDISYKQTEEDKEYITIEMESLEELEEEYKNA